MNVINQKIIEQFFIQEGIIRVKLIILIMILIVFAKWLNNERRYFQLGPLPEISPSQISDMLQAEFAPVQNLSSGFVS